ncbi:MAG: serine/threonine protein kinase, partial [Myxococcales bacterium]|nr:serine/threonine protein kinase [Myxococcales bacterium]
MSDIKLPDRFVGHGVIGRGGQAVVVLATDTLRGERVALKVVHPHLAADPSTRRRLQREVRAASLLHSDAALVPYDLHEVEGTVALSMPFHPGQTVAERVGAEGPLPPEDLRAIGIRVGKALADAHAAGILHRDVSATNVLTGTDPARDTVLADFGLARVIGQTATATRAAGTLGYAAPEVLASGRADARSDLYGLGAVLFFAATGRTVMDAGQRSVGELRPDLPSDLVTTVDALLARDPAERPQAATEVVDALEQRISPHTQPDLVHEPAPTTVAAPPSGRWFAQGSSAVWLREGEADRERRKTLRRKARGEHRPSPVDELTRWGTHVAGRVREALGIPAPDPASPEERLVGALEAEAGLPSGALVHSPQLLLPGFVLIDGIDRPTADRLADAAASAGFHAEVRDGGHLENRIRRALPVMIAAMVAMVAVGSSQAEPWSLVALVALAVVAVNAIRRGRRERHVVPAYEPTLSGALRPGVVTSGPRPVARPTPTPQPEAQEETRGQALRRRAELALDALEGVDDLPEPALVDVRATAKDLRRQAAQLADQVDR